MKIIITGDVSDWNVKNFQVGNIDEKYLELIKRANLVIYNLEGPIIGRESDKYKLQIRNNAIKDFFYNILLKYTKNIQPLVSSTPNILSLLKINKKTVVTLANNHIKDGGYNGFIETINYLNSNGIIFTGGGNNSLVARKPLEIDGIAIINVNYVSSKKFGVLFKLYNATNNSYGGAYLNFHDIKKIIKKYRDGNTTVLLIIHGGKEMPSSYSKIGIDLEAIKRLNSNITIIHHFHKYIKTEYEKNNIFIIGDLIFKRDGYLPPERDTGLLTIDFLGNGNSICKMVKFKVSNFYKYE
jgi:hypothetical protein